MKIIVFSDSHGDFKSMIAAIKQEQRLDAAVHLGDGAEDFEKIKKLYPSLIFHNVKGNCDYNSFLPTSLRVNYQNNLIFITHGHKFGVKQSILKIAEEGKKIGARLLLYGHTHRGRIDELPEITLMNPGSISGNCSNPTYGIINISNGEIEGEIVLLKKKDQNLLANEKLNYLESVEGSTNTLLLNHKEPLGNYTAVYTFDQRGGRGRLGRKWEEEKGCGLALSVAYNLPISKIPPIPLIVGLSVAKTLENSFGLEAGLKWSNDIIVSKKKIVGILCDSKSSKENTILVMGIGVNLFQSEESFLKNALPYAGSLAMLGVKEINPHELAEKLLEDLKIIIEEYMINQFSGKLLEKYKEKCITIGKEVSAEKNHQKRIGRALDIEQDGGLLCDFNGEKEVVYGGEVSVRGLYDYTD